MNEDEAHLIGQQTLGPIFIAWVNLLLREARTRQIQRLLFVARDGFLLHQVTETFLESAGSGPQFSLDYVHLSRRATKLPATMGMTRDGIAEALAVRAGPLTLSGLLEYHGIEADTYCPLLERIGVAPRTPIINCQQGMGLIGDTQVTEMVCEQATLQRAALLDYLVGQHLVGKCRSALVDIGWRGSIQKNLTRVLASMPHLTPPSGLYFGVWCEDGGSSELPKGAIGLVGDLRRGRNMREAAPWQSAFLLEAICRGDEGTTQCFRMIKGQGMAVLADPSGEARIAELLSQELATAVRAGILDYVRRHARDDHWQMRGNHELRHEVQDRLLRLAFLPTAPEIALGECLVHTEGHNLQWSTPLILPRQYHPILSPRRWLAGLASPWRGGYVMATGKSLAWLYRGVESILTAAPPGLRSGVRRAALRLASSLTTA